MPEPTLIFPYATPATQWGVSTDRRPDRLRVVVPPAPSWRKLPLSYVGLGLLGVSLAMAVAGFFAHSLSDMYISIEEFALLGLGNLAWVLYRLHTRTIIDVTKDRIRITTLTPFMPPASRGWNKAEVGEIKFNRVNGKLFLRITGKSLPEFFISSDRDVSEWVANTIRDAFFTETFEPLHEAEEFAPRVVKRKKSLAIIFLVATAFACAGIILSAITKNAGFALGMLATAFAVLMVGGGITLGTQEKEYFT